MMRDRNGATVTVTGDICDSVSNETTAATPIASSRPARIAIHLRTPIEKRRDEVAADRDAGENRREHQREAVHGGPEEQRQDAEPDDLERERREAGNREHGENEIQAAAVRATGTGGLSRPASTSIGQPSGGRTVTPRRVRPASKGDRGRRAG